MKDLNISEERLRELVLRALKELGENGNRGSGSGKKQKLYMICGSPWNEAYETCLKEMEASDACCIYPVIPASWKKQGHEEKLRSFRACAGILYRSGEKPADLEQAVSLFPVVDRDVLVKTALCISDTFETSWIAASMAQGGRTVFLRSGLERFSGKEKPAWVNRIMDYYRQVLEYGIEICSLKELDVTGEAPELFTGKPVKPEYVPLCTPVTVCGKKRVITAASIDRFASGGVIDLQPDDIVTDLAKDRARFLNISFK